MGDYIEFENWPDMVQWKLSKIYSEIWWAGVVEEIFSGIPLSERAMAVGVSEKTYAKRLNQYKTAKGGKK